MSGADQSALKTKPRRSTPSVVRLTPEFVNTFRVQVAGTTASGATGQAKRRAGLLFGASNYGVLTLGALRLLESAVAEELEAGPLNAPSVIAAARFAGLAAAFRADPTLEAFQLVGWCVIRRNAGLGFSDLDFHNRHFRRISDVALVVSPEQAGNVAAVELYSKTTSAPMSGRNQGFSLGNVATTLEATVPLELNVRQRIDEAFYMKVYQVSDSDEAGNGWLAKLKMGFGRRGNLRPDEVATPLGKGAGTPVAATPMSAALKPLTSLTVAPTERVAPTEPVPAKNVEAPELAEPAPLPTEPAPASAVVSLPEIAAVEPPPPVVTPIASPAASLVEFAPIVAEEISPAKPAQEAEPEPLKAPVSVAGVPAHNVLSTAEPVQDVVAPHDDVRQEVKAPAAPGPERPPQSEADTPAQEPGAVFVAPARPRRSGLRLGFWPLLIGALIGILTAAVAYTIQTRGRTAPPVAVYSRPDTAPPPGDLLQLRVTGEGDRLLVSWDRTNKTVRAAETAALQITDGQQHRTINLSKEEIDGGAIIYRPNSPDVLFRLELRDRAGKTSSGVIQSIDGSTPPVPAAKPAAAVPLARTPGQTAPARSAIQSVVDARRPAPEAKQTQPAAPVNDSELGLVPLPTGNDRPWVAVSRPVVDTKPASFSSSLQETQHASAPEPAISKPEVKTDSVLPPAPAAAAGARAEPPVTSALGFYLPPVPLRQVVPQTRGTGIMVYKKAEIAIQVRVDESGRVKTAKLIPGQNPVSLSLAGASMKAALQWQFRPATLRGVAVTGDYTVTFRFEPSHY